MPAIIDELKSEHRLILELLRAAVKLGVNSPAAAAELANAKDLVVSHLEKEDKHIYPVLYSRAKRDEELRHTLNTVHPATASALSDLKDFLSDYEAGGLGIGHSGNIAFILMALEARIQVEECQLYELYLQAQRGGTL